MLKESEGRLRYLEHSEEARLLDVSPEPLRSIIVIGANTGIRINSEGLTRNGPMWICRVSSYRTAAYSKNGHTRSIPLDSRAREVLQHLKRQPKRIRFLQTQRPPISGRFYGPTVTEGV
jgi:hypothetical protein